MLKLPAGAVEALVGSGYLVPSGAGTGGPEFPLSDLKAFLARNVDNGSGYLLRKPDASGRGRRLDPQDLLDAVEHRAGEMARRCYHLFAAVFSEAESWALQKQAEFIAQARGRFEAILAVVAQGPNVDDALVEELRGVGAQAAEVGSSLPQLLVILRISRDLVIQTAVELAGPAGPLPAESAGVALSLLLTRLMPAVDRLIDAVGQGYWETVAVQGRPDDARYRQVLDNTGDGVVEVDADGRVVYANAAFALVVAQPRRRLEGVALGQMLRSAEPGALDGLFGAVPEIRRRVLVTIWRADRVQRFVSVERLPRYVEGRASGWWGIVRDEGGPVCPPARPLELRPAVLAALAANAFPESVAADVEEGVTVLADPQLLDQALQALIAAATSHPRGGPAVIAAVQRRDEVVVAVNQMVLSPLEPIAVPASLRELFEALGGRVWTERRALASGLVAALPAPSRAL